MVILVGVGIAVGVGVAVAFWLRWTCASFWSDEDSTWFLVIVPVNELLHQCLNVGFQGENQIFCTGLVV